jgi:hypothetical protein
MEKERAFEVFRLEVRRISIITAKFRQQDWAVLVCSSLAS